MPSSDAYLKNAAQLRHLATRIANQDARSRILSIAREYEQKATIERKIRRLRAVSAIGVRRSGPKGGWW